MDKKVADRYVDILIYMIDKNARKNKNRPIDKNIFLRTFSNLTEKTYKSSMVWFVGKNIFQKLGTTFDTKYRLHDEFSYKLSKSSDTVKKQARFIIGQLGIFSNMQWDEPEVLYKDIVLNTDRFDFISPIKHNIISDTVSEILVKQHNTNHKGVYPYEFLQTLISLKSTFNIEIKNSQLNIKMKSVKLKKITFNDDTIDIKLNNATFKIESLGNIKLIEMKKIAGLRNRVDKSLELLQKKYDKNSVKKLIYLMKSSQLKEDLFFQKL